MSKGTRGRKRQRQRQRKRDQRRENANSNEPTTLSSQVFFSFSFGVLSSPSPWPSMSHGSLLFFPAVCFFFSCWMFLRLSLSSCCCAFSLSFSCLARHLHPSQSVSIPKVSISLCMFVPRHVSTPLYICMFLYICLLPNGFESLCFWLASVCVVRCSFALVVSCVSLSLVTILRYFSPLSTSLYFSLLLFTFSSLILIPWT